VGVTALAEEVAVGRQAYGELLKNPDTIVYIAFAIWLKGCEWYDFIAVPLQSSGIMVDRRRQLD